MLSIDIDLQPLFDTISQYFPVFLAVLAVPAGIGIAIKLVDFIIKKVQMAF